MGLSLSLDYPVAGLQAGLGGGRAGTDDLHQAPVAPFILLGP